jgi:putative transposase
MRRSVRAASLWHVPDGLWKEIRPILEPETHPRAMGRPRADSRRILDGILFRLRTGCQWNHIPPVFGSDSTLHRYYLQWTRSGILDKVWALLVRACPDLERVLREPERGNGARR